MKYSFFISRRAQKELARLPIRSYERIVVAIRKLAENPRPSGVRKLSGREGWRIRVGDYRVIYQIDDKQGKITVRHVGHRREIYRKA